MNLRTQPTAVAVAITKADPTTPAIVVAGLTVAIKAGTAFNGHTFAADTPVPVPGAGFTIGSDLVVAIDGDGLPHIRQASSLADCHADDVLGGFHFAPGGNAAARVGGDDVPAINPRSLWDRAFRPACPDPRGMVLVDAPGHRFWCDIYLTAADHLAGTSRFGVTIADGNDSPENPAGKRFKKFDYPTAQAVVAHHGKGLLSIEEFFAAAFGVTEKTAAGDEPTITGLDAPRTSRWGLMQATGNMWVWGHDGDPDEPRASLFGGSWIVGGGAGSRRADVGNWPGNSHDIFGARARCDHLQPV